jgi:hypothetical protein
MSRFDLAGSHIPLLMEALRVTKNGHVLEMGMGWNSTPLLHWMCFDMNRLLLSLEGDKDWRSKFADYESSSHLIVDVDDWDYPEIDKYHWSVVLIDHKPALRRHVDAIRMADKADIVILHDTEPEIDKYYAYRRVWGHYKYRYDWDKVKPYTTALSNTIDLQKEFYVRQA